MALQYDVRDLLKYNGIEYPDGSIVNILDVDVAKGQNTRLLELGVIEGSGIFVPEDTGSNPTNNEGLYDPGEPIPLFKIVFLHPDNRIYLASNVVEEECRTALGISIENSNGRVRIRYEGKVANPVWNFQRGKPLFLHSNGEINQSIPNGNILQIGEAISPTLIKLEFREVEIRNT